MAKHRYTKAKLEELVACQLDNLDAMHDLLQIMKFQNDLISNANKKLKAEIEEFKSKHTPYSIPKKKK